MSIVMNFAPFVDMTLLSSNLTVRRLAVGVPQSMSMLSRTLHTILLLVMSRHLFSGISFLWMKNIVSVPMFLPGIP